MKTIVPFVRVIASAVTCLLAPGCAAAPAGGSTAPPASAPSSSPAYGASDVPPGWTTIDTPDGNAVAFSCSVSSGEVAVTVWNISDVQEQAWHLTVAMFDGAQQTGTLDDDDFDIGDNWVQPGQKMMFRQATQAGGSCQVTGNS